MKPSLKKFKDDIKNYPIYPVEELLSLLDFLKKKTKDKAILELEECLKNTPYTHLQMNEIEEILHKLEK